jgi:hypothetical protein
MTISSQTRKAGPFTGNGATTTFPFTFKVFAASDLYVVRTDATTGIDTVLVLGTDYTVTLNTNQNSSPGGSITLPTALASGFKLTATSALQYLQPTDLTNQGGFYPKVINDALDRLTIFCQQLLDQVGRSLKISIATPAGVNTTLPAPAANKLIGWNATADNLQNMDPTTLATIVAFGTANADIFSGTGSQTAFTLTANPGTLNNLDVSISGVTQKPGIDYTWSSGTTITFTSAPPSGTNNVLVRYLQALPQGVTDAGLVTYSDTGGYTTGSVGYRLKQLISSVGSSLIGFIQSGTGAVARFVQDKLRENVSVIDFGADPSGISDSTSAFQAAITYGQTTGYPIRIPAGTYKITSTLNVTASLTLVGDGVYKTSIKLASSSVVSAFAVAAPSNSALSVEIGNFSLTCNAGSAICDAFTLSTSATNAALVQSAFRDMRIFNVRYGFNMSGVIYMSAFRNITVSGTGGGIVTAYGWYAYEATGQIIYNSWDNCEVTNTGPAAYSYYVTAAASQFRNITCDGVCYFAGAYSHMQGFSLEGIYSASVPSPYAIQLNQFQSLSDVAIINVPNSKCTYGISMLGGAISINNVRFPDAGAGNQPNSPFALTAGGTGTISNVKFDRAVVNKLESYLSESVLNGYTFAACADITSRGVYAQGTWTPTFTSWTTAPSVISAQYTQVGRQVTATLYATGGVNNYNGIGGLPVAANATQGAAGVINSSSNIPLYAGCSVIPGASAISGFNVTMTGAYWQLTVTYFA